jgi:hypothetical protein
MCWIRRPALRCAPSPIPRPRPMTSLARACRCVKPCTGRGAER